MFSSYKFDAINTRIASISPGAEHFFGTDTYGRDLFVRVWTGTRYSLFIAVVAIFIDVIVGMTYGLISGYFGGKVDSVMQRIQEIINSIPTLDVYKRQPSFVFAMLILLLFASKLRLLPTSYSSSNAIKSSIMPILALSVGVIANVARFTRTEMVSVLTSEYMTLAKAKGLDRKTCLLYTSKEVNMVKVLKQF